MVVVPTQNSAAPLPSSPFAFFEENDLLRLWLRSLNTVLTVYCIVLVGLLVNTSCTGYTASFHCDPTTRTTSFAQKVSRLHTFFALYFGLSAWSLRRPRRWFVHLNTTAFAGFGLALIGFGINQCALASRSRNVAASAMVGMELVLLGFLTSVGGGYGGWCYHKRRMLEIRVVVELLIPSNR